MHDKQKVCSTGMDVELTRTFLPSLAMVFIVTADGFALVAGRLR